MSRQPQFHVVIPAAGHSQRMGRPKLALPLGNSTVLERGISAFRAAGVDSIVVVLAPHTQELEALAENAGAETFLWDSETPDMRATVQHGLRYLQRQKAPTEHDMWFLIPADHPTLSTQVIEQLRMEALRNENSASAKGNLSIHVPTYHGRRGHPVLIAWSHVEAILAIPEGQGINSYLRTQQQVTREVPIDDESILVDLDTPDDYLRLRARYS